MSRGVWGQTAKYVIDKHPQLCFATKPSFRKTSLGFKTHVGILVHHAVWWNEQPILDCLCCDQPENAQHAWQCRDPAVFFVCWALLMSSLSKWLAKVHAANDVIHWIIQRLTKWRSSEPFSSPAQSDMPGPLQAISAQDRIGWLAFFEGCIAIEWVGVQEDHFVWLGCRNTGKRRAISLFVKLWEAAWDLQDHWNQQIKKKLKTAQDVVGKLLCSPSVWNVPSVALVCPNRTGSFQPSSLVCSRKLTASPRSLASSGSRNCTLTERQTQCGRCQPQGARCGRRSTKHKWPSTHPAEFPDLHL
jgi:hypothetical protein